MWKEEKACGRECNAEEEEEEIRKEGYKERIKMLVSDWDFPCQGEAVLSKPCTRLCV